MAGFRSVDGKARPPSLRNVLHGGAGLAKAQAPIQVQGQGQPHAQGSGQTTEQGRRRILRLYVRGRKIHYGVIFRGKAIREL